MNPERLAKIRALANDPAAFPGERENAIRILAAHEPRVEVTGEWTHRPSSRGSGPARTVDEVRDLFARAFGINADDVELDAESAALLDAMLHRRREPRPPVRPNVPAGYYDDWRRSTAEWARQRAQASE